MITIADEGLLNQIIAYGRKLGLTDNGIAGLCGNLYAESGIRSDNLQNSYNTKFGMTDAQFVQAVDNGSFNFLCTDRGAWGFGLAQWTSLGRRSGLKALVDEMKVSIADGNAQIIWLFTELQRSYKSVFALLKDSEATIEECSTAVLQRFEVPAGRFEDKTINARISYSKEILEKYVKQEDKKMGYLMTADQFVAKLVDIATKYKTLYIMGCFGAPMTATNKNRYTQNHTYNKQATRTAMIRSASGDTFGFDCVGLVKAVLWGWCGDTSRVYGGSGYKYNGVPDTDAKKMQNYCFNLSKDFSKIKKGEFLWMDGHCGVYGGQDANGRHFVIESSPKWANKVQITYLANLGETAGNCRTWTTHGELQWIDYSKVSKAPVAVPESKPAPQPVTTASYIVKKGDTLNKIAKANNMSLSDLLALNPQISNPNRINVGDKINLVKATSVIYKVKAGDTLTKIAKANNTTVQKLAELNGLSNPSLIRVGQELRIK